jgi:CheY-like chemotaxis protein
MARHRVLVVDDTPAIRLLLRLNLELEGFDVQECADGGEALALLRDESRLLPDVVTIDAVMEPVDGWTAVADIRRDPRLAHLPVVMVTASVQAHHRARAVRRGVDAFVDKPFEPMALVAVVRSLAESGRPAQPPA